MIVVLSGPSGVGKDTVIDAWKKSNPLVERTVAVTTRSPRPGEVSGIDYEFVSVKQFDLMVDNGQFLEHKHVHGNWYGTPCSSVDRLLAEGKIAVLKIDVQGAREVKRLRPEAVRIFLMAPTFEVLRARLKGRGTDSEEEIDRRLANALREMNEAADYDYQVINDQIEDVVQRLNEIVARVSA